MVEKKSNSANAYFLSFVGPDYSRSSTLLNFKTPSITKHYVHLNTSWMQMFRDFLKMRKTLDNNPVLIVMSPSHKATFPAKVLTGKKVILDAGWPLTDGVLSRGITFITIPKLIKSFLLDLLSFHFADVILVESRAQLERIHRIFGIPVNRIRVSFTGVNESLFSLSGIETPTILKFKADLFYCSQKINVLFRGRINKESGIEKILAAAKILESEANFILVTGPNRILENVSSNCFLYSNITESEIAEIYKNSDVALGQISHHRRLMYTIPHKAFEAGYFGKPYISPKSSGILELYSEGSAYFIEDDSIGNLVTAIRKFKDSSLRKMYQDQISKRYTQFASQRVLNSNFERIIFEN